MRVNKEQNIRFGLIGSSIHKEAVSKEYNVFSKPSHGFLGKARAGAVSNLSMVLYNLKVSNNWKDAFGFARIIFTQYCFGIQKRMLTNVPSFLPT